MRSSQGYDILNIIWMTSPVFAHPDLSSYKFLGDLHNLHLEESEQKAEPLWPMALHDNSGCKI